MTNSDVASQAQSDFNQIFNILERDLIALSELNAAKAAAHLDTAIQQLRRDQLLKADLDLDRAKCGYVHLTENKAATYTEQLPHPFIEMKDNAEGSGEA